MLKKLSSSRSLTPTPAGGEVFTSSSSEDEEDEEVGAKSFHAKISLARALHRMLTEWFTPVERILLVLSALAIIAVAFLGLLLPKLAGNFLDTMGEMDDNGALLTLVVVVTLNQGMYGLTSLALNWVAENVALRLRQNTFNALMSKPQYYFDATPKQQMLQSNLADIDCIRVVVSQEAGLVWERFFTAVGGVVAISMVSQTLALYTLIIAPIIALSLSFVGERVVYPLEQRARETIVECSEALDENFGNVHIVRSFGMENAVSRRFQIPVMKRFSADRKSSFGLTLFKGSIFYIAGMVLLFACWYGRNMVRYHHTIRAGDLVAFLVYAVQIAVSLANSTRGLALCNLGYVCALKTLDLLDSKAQQVHEDIGNGTLAFSPQTLRYEEVAFNNVTFAYPTAGRRHVKVLQDLSLVLHRGKSVALVGPSGAGKSSVVSLLEKFYSPTSGSIVIDGKTNLQDVPTKLWRSKIGLVTQDPCLFAGTIYENIALGRPDETVTVAEVERAAQVANVLEFSREFPLGLHQQIGHRGGHLSSGQRQRVAVARAILRDPKILLLDEHTSALDAQSERMVQDSMDAMVHGRITLMIAHRLQTARRADEICVLKEGKIVERGTHDQLVNIEGGAYHALWLAQLSKDDPSAS